MDTLVIHLHVDNTIVGDLTKNININPLLKIFKTIDEFNKNITIRGNMLM